MIAIWIAIGIVAALGIAAVYACIVAGSDAEKSQSGCRKHPK